MSSSLRARLKAMGGGESAPRAVSRGGLRVIERDEALARVPGDAVEARIMRRLGADFDWPGAERALFLDAETTGLSRGAGTIAFLVGAGYVRGDRFHTVQYLMGDYPDEPELLEQLSRLADQFDVLVTFNGRTFDVPLLETRYTMNRMRERMPSLRHLDLLPPARRLWKRRLGSVKMSVLEERILMAGRSDDLPGSEAPRRFFEYLKCGDERLLEPVIEHNRLDVVALGRLLTGLASAYGDPTGGEERADLFSLGRTLEKQGDAETAIRCYHLAALPRPVMTVAQLRSERYAGEALMAMSLLYKKRGERAKAARGFERLADRALMGARPMVEMAKYCEHALKDGAAALGWTNRALAAERDERARAELKRRKARLERKLEG